MDHGFQIEMRAPAIDQMPEEAIQIREQMWRDDEGRYHGKHY